MKKARGRHALKKSAGGQREGVRRWSAFLVPGDDALGVLPPSFTTDPTEDVARELLGPAGHRTAEGLSWTHRGNRAYLGPDDRLSCSGG